jgi:hypothetical protein
VGQLGDPVGGHGAAGVHVGVDERPERGRALQTGLKCQAELGGDGMVGPEPGRHHHLIGLHDQPLGLNVVALEVAAGQPDPVTDRLGRVDPEAADELDPAGLDQGGQIGGQSAPGRELVSFGTALADQRPRGR